MLLSPTSIRLEIVEVASPAYLRWTVAHAEQLKAHGQDFAKYIVAAGLVASDGDPDAVTEGQCYEGTDKKRMFRKTYNEHLLQQSSS